MTGCTYDTNLYLGKDKLYIDNFFSSPDIVNDLHTRGINCWGTVRQNCKRIPRGPDSKTLKLKQGSW
jgi:hypothetical protein